MVESGPPTELNTIHAGVGSFASTNYGCSDNTCAGFVQVTEDKSSVLGAIISPTVPVGASDKYCLAVKIQRDQSTGNWWLAIGDSETNIGYWPKEMFNHLNNGASKVRFGGETYASSDLLSPPMGSGRLPKEGYQYSALFGKLQYIDSEYSHIDVISMKPFSDTKPDCYDLKYYDELGKVYRRALMYGGPGGKCDV
ncbi:DUF239 domain protein [Trifolium medium]|uniref:DUF239 domain protein n=1 Tax=Trifolium medium TaxID=97028 RepID=A0A392M9X7_9FABA|nr:DUF239 domain protein [Trifolium medium]